MTSEHNEEAPDPVKGLPAFEVRGKRVREDAYGFVSLDDIWTIANGKPSQSPPQWRAAKGVQRLILALQKKMVTANLEGKTRLTAVIYAKRGRGSIGTFAHPILAAVYAGYLSPKLELEVREVWLRFRAGDANLADEILERASAEDNERVGVRALGRVERVAYTATLQAHGVIGAGYAHCTDAVYDQVLGGSARQLKKAANLPANANLRDHLGSDELKVVMVAEMMARGRIETENSQGNEECTLASRRSASFLRNALEQEKADRKKAS